MAGFYSRCFRPTEEENDRAILIIEELLAKGDKISSEENALL